MEQRVEEKPAEQRLVGQLIFSSSYRYPSSKSNKPKYRFVPTGSDKSFLVASNLVTRTDQYAIVDVVDDSAQLVRILGPVGDWNAETLARVYYRGINLKNPPKLFETGSGSEFGTNGTGSEFGTNGSGSELGTGPVDFDPVNYFKENLKHIDRTDLKVYSIDPKGCCDIDDAFTCEKIGSGSGTLARSRIRLSIHIADVAFYIEHFGLKLADLRPSSVYLPDKTHNMLPNLLATNWASLSPEKRRLAWTISCEIADSGSLSEKITVERTIIRSSKAWTYEEAAESEDPMIEALREIAGSRDTHKMIEFLMVFANSQMALYLKDKQIIYRTHEAGDIQVTEVPKELQLIMTRLQSAAATYTESTGKHSGLNVDSYIHFTSPLRRKVDLYHHLLLSGLFQSINVEEINNFNKGLKKLEKDIDYLSLLFQRDPEQSGRVSSSIYLIDRPESENRSEESKATAYFPKESLILDFRLVQRELSDIITCQHRKDNLRIDNLQTGWSLTYNKYQPIDVDIYLHPKASNFYDKIKIKLPSFDWLLQV